MKKIILAALLLASTATFAQSNDLGGFPTIDHAAPVKISGGYYYPINGRKAGIKTIDSVMATKVLTEAQDEVLSSRKRGSKYIIYVSPIAPKTRRIICSRM